MSNQHWGSITHVPMQDMNWVTPREPSHDLDRQAFLNLLITQLRYQDPLNPMDDRDFIAQMAQFSALEQMMNLNATFERTQAFGMIGKLIDATFSCPATGDRIDIQGELITSVMRRGQSVYLVVTKQDGTQVDVPFDAVTEVYEDFLLSAQLNDLFIHIQGQRASELIGKYVMGFARVGEDSEFVEGRVDSVTMRGRTVILHVGNQQLLFPYDIFSASAPRVPGESGMRLIGSRAFRSSAGEQLTVAGVDVVRRGDEHHLYLRFEETTIPQRVQLINHVVDALTYVGQRISFGVVTNGLVESITMMGGIPFLNIPDHDTQIDFLAYLADRHGTTSDSDGEDND